VAQEVAGSRPVTRPTHLFLRHTWSWLSTLGDAAAAASGTFFREAAHDAEDRFEGRSDRWPLGSPRLAARLNLAGVLAFSRSYL
jgi:hypothetical protein